MTNPNLLLIIRFSGESKVKMSIPSGENTILGLTVDSYWTLSIHHFELGHDIKGEAMIGMCRFR